jgi:hypothetical protein
VAWRPPSDTVAGLETIPWAVAGEGDVAPPAAVRPPALVWWVGAPEPSGARSCENWPALTAQIQEALQASAGGVTLAPACGIQVPGGGYLQGMGWLETVLAAGQRGVPSPGAAELRRLRALLVRRRLPLRLVETDGAVRVEAEG